MLSSQCRKSVEINGLQSAAMGRGNEEKAPILRALGNDGQQRAPVKTGSTLTAFRHFQDVGSPPRCSLQEPDDPARGGGTW